VSLNIAEKTIFVKLFGMNKDSCIDIVSGYLGYLSIQGELDKKRG